MKEKIMYLILGILIGAVITAGVFLVFSKNSQPQMMGGNDGQMGERPDFSNMTDDEKAEMMEKRGDGEKPDTDSSQESTDSSSETSSSDSSSNS